MLFFNAKGGTPYIQKISGADGLPSQTIYDLYVSKEGYLYIGTDLGLIQYNGVYFKKFPFLGNTSNALNAIKEDANGTVWCMNFANQLFYLENDTLKASKSTNDTIAKYGLLKSFEFVNDDLWILTEKNILVKKNGVFNEVMPTNKRGPNFSFFDLRYDQDLNSVFISDLQFISEIKEEKLYKKTPLNRGFNEFTLGPNKELVFALKTDPYNIHINRLDGPPVNVDHMSRQNYLNHLVTTDERVWMCTNGGLFELDVKKHTLKSPIIENIRVSDIVMDNEGGYWVSSVEKGLFYIPDFDLKVSSLSEYNLNTIEKGPNNTFLVGTGNGNIIQIDSSGHILNRYAFNFTSEIEFIHYDQSNQTIISSHGLIDCKSKTVLAHDRLGKSIDKLDGERYLLSTYNKSIIIRKNKEKRLTEQSYPQNSASYFEIEEIVREHRCNKSVWSKLDQRYYLAFSDGLMYYSSKKDIKKTGFVLNRDEKVFVADMVFGKDGETYVATLHSGVLVLKNGVVVRRFDKSNGLSGNTCKKIAYSEDFLMVINDGGLNVVDFKKNTVTNLSIVSGIRNVGLYDVIIEKNRVYLCSNEGLFVFTLDDQMHVTLPNIVRLQADSKLGGVLLNHNLPHDQNDIKFTIEAVHFKNKNNYSFEYRLLGYDSTWYSQPSQDNTVNYISLPPGNYLFEVKTKIGGYSSEVISFGFIIAPSFWSTPLFLILLFLGTLILVYFLFNIYLKRLRKKQIVYEKLLKSQIVALRSQMNPHFLFNVLNSLQGLIYTNKKNEASKYLGMFSNLMRSSLEYSDKQTIPLKNEIEMIEAYLELESSRFESGFTMNIIKDFPEEKEGIHIPSMIVQPFVENAIKHGLMHKKGDKNLEVVFSIKKTHLEVTIKDNGIGRAASETINKKRKKHSSFATKAIDSRISLMNKFYDSSIQINIKDIKNDSGEVSGTNVIIQLPIRKDYE